MALDQRGANMEKDTVLSKGDDIMRDPDRIDKFCAELAELWHKVPDWRFGQLIVNVYGHSTRDPFFLEEDESMELFKEVLCQKS